MPRPSANDITQGTLPKISHGRGVYLWDVDGRQYIDGSGGPAVFSIGHGDPRVNEAVARQMEKVAYGYRYLFTTDPLEEMSEIICKATGLADTRTLIIPVAHTIFWEAGPAVRAAMGMGDGMIRLSVGLEEAEDLLADFEQALSAG